MRTNQPLKNADAVTADERIELKRRESDGRPSWAGVAAVLALALLAYENVAHRDAMVALKERQAAELAKKDAELALYRPTDRNAGRCSEWTTIPYDQVLEVSCHRTVSRM